MKVWYCGYRQSTASPQDWMEATYEWHQGAIHMVEQRMEDVLPWCPICRGDAGLHLAADDPMGCKWMQLVPADARIGSREAIVIEKVDGNWPPQALNYLAEAFMEAARQSNDGFIRLSERYRLAEFTLGALVSVSDPTKTANV